MISVVIPTLNAERGLAPTLSALVPAAIEGVVRDVIVCDGGSTDGTAEIADAAGALFVPTKRGRGQQLAAGAAKARSDWLLFLHADTVLGPGWVEEAATFMKRVGEGERPQAAGAFRFALDDQGARPRLVETLVGLRCALLRLPYGDQGLLISRRLYHEIGGFKEIPLMEDVDLVRRLGRRRLVMLRTTATTSAFRYKRDGYLRRALRNLSCVTLYFLRVPPRLILRLYG